MDSILAPSADGTYQTVFGKQREGLFLQGIEQSRFVFRHTASGLSLFYFLGEEVAAQKIQNLLIERYDFQRDSTWVLKSQGELHGALLSLGLERTWIHRSWHYRLCPKTVSP